MLNSRFPRFTRELSQHSALGYHALFGPVDRIADTAWFGQQLICCPVPYVDFLNEIGPGRFFAGDLVLFPTAGAEASVQQVTKKLPETVRSRFFAIGYDGTTEGCYCLIRTGDDNCVYWHNWGMQTTALHHPDFIEWIENSPNELFNKAVYAGYKTIKDISGALGIVKERCKFEVRLLEYDKQLVRPPGKEKDFLPRYNRIVSGVRKYAASPLEQLTLKVRRLGTTVGEDNIQYVTLDVSGVPVDMETRLEAYVFDPFNLPFESINIDYSPEIDLSSPMRARYAEIKVYL